MLHSDDASAMKEWRWGVRRAKKVNQERHSLRCDIELKLSVMFHLHLNFCFAIVVLLLCGSDV